jgi:DinB superfamily
MAYTAGEGRLSARRLAPPIAMLLEFLDEAFEKKSWHGPNLRAAIRGVKAEQAAWRPGPERHNIWELTLHAAYWKYVVRRRLTGEKRGSFVLPGSNFFPRPIELTEAAWKADVQILVDEHRKLRSVVAKLSSPSRTQAHLIRGAAAHDLYHAGQIRLLRRLCSS